MTDWFARPILNVTNVELSVRFYVDQLGFSTAWHYDEGGRTRIAQVDGLGCAFILAETWPERIGKGLTFISLNLEPVEQIAALDALREELQAKGVVARDGSWGYRLLIVEDPDGNQLLFNYPAETTSGKRLQNVTIRRGAILVVPINSVLSRAVLAIFVDLYCHAT